VDGTAGDRFRFLLGPGCSADPTWATRENGFFFVSFFSQLLLGRSRDFPSFLIMVKGSFSWRRANILRCLQFLVFTWMCTCFCTQGTGKDEYSSKGIPLLDPGESFQGQFEDNILLEKGENINLLQDENITLKLSGTTSSKSRISSLSQRPSYPMITQIYE
jgi:hypothetical protein